MYGFIQKDNKNLITRPENYPSQIFQPIPTEESRKHFKAVTPPSKYQGYHDFCPYKLTYDSEEPTKPAPQCPDIFALEKQHFMLDEHGRIKVTHPAFKGKAGLLLFYLHGCPNCQDTKVVWSALGMLGNRFGTNLAYTSYDNYPFIYHVKNDYPSLKIIRPDGILINYRGPLNFESVDQFIKKNCKYLRPKYYRF